MSERIIMGMSGGVDSSVAAYELKKKGFDVECVFMKNWDDDSDECPAEKDYRDALSVCHSLNLPLHTVNFTEEYKSLVFSHTFYYLEHLVGKIKNIECSLVSSHKSLNKADTTINMKLLFENGCNGEIFVDISNDKDPKHTIKFFGSEGTLSLENLSSDMVDNFNLKLSKNYESQNISIAQKLNFLKDENEDPRIKVVANLTQKFVKWYNTGIPEKPNFEDGLRVQELIQMARISNKGEKNFEGKI